MLETNTNDWFTQVSAKLGNQNTQVIQDALNFCQLAGNEIIHESGETCMQYALCIADTLAKLSLDAETLAAAITYIAIQYSDLTLDDVEEHLSPKLAKLVLGIQKMDAIRTLHQKLSKDQRHQIDNLRKMLLAMVDDVRVVLIKLVERLHLLRHAKRQDKQHQRELARETMDIYAPLANRLGIWQLKWELEDLSFRFMEPEKYQDLAKQMQSRRADRERIVSVAIEKLLDMLHQSGIKDANIQGRAKHIYSIHKKMQRKNVDYNEIYDSIAVRVLVPTIEDCYSTLGFVHNLWQQIPEEYDDYVANPKPNGYRSLHTAVKGPEGNNLEVQIRTHQMHDESELGVAAHWHYKEGGSRGASHERKIVWLRQVLEWQKELAKDENAVSNLETEVFEDRVYVFTPAGDIIDLPSGATPLDFAYTVHSEVGHRCKGAKINNKIVPLTYALQTSDHVEVLTAKHPNPSRDWMNPQSGYLKTSRARAKVHHWFMHQDQGKHLDEGKAIMERELKRLGIEQLDYTKAMTKLNYKSLPDLYTAIGSGNVKSGNVINIAHTKPAEKEVSLTIKHAKPAVTLPTDINIEGVGKLLTITAKCCKPLPGDDIIGYITQGRGVSIHRKDCLNILNIDDERKERLIPVSWGTAIEQHYPVDISITTDNRRQFVKDLTGILSQEKISILALNTVSEAQNGTSHLLVTLELSELASLKHILEHINQLKSVIYAKRVSAGT